MSLSEMGLAALVAPVEVERFFAEYWEKQSLLIPRDRPDYFAGLLSAADVDQVIAFTRPKFVDSGAFTREESRAKPFVQGWLADRQMQEGAKYADIEELHRVYTQGKTVIIMTMQRRWLPVARLCRNLEAVFHCPVHANMYLTPKGAQGFDAHFDPHEVFVLQLEGSKHWRLYESARDLPLIDERFETPKDRLGPPRDVVLNPGDLLYIPRGHVHEAFTSEAPSLHLTVGVNVYRWADLLHEALDDLARRDVRLRESLPPGGLASTQAAAVLKNQFQELLAAVTQEASIEGAVQNLGTQFFSQLPALPEARFTAPPETDGIDADTVLEKSAGVVCRVIESPGWVEIEFPGGRVGGPPKIASALRFVASRERFAVRELPDSLGQEGKLVLARRLVRERLLRGVLHSASKK